MKTIIETTQLSQPRCSYILDLFHNNDNRFSVEIIQIDEIAESSQSITISNSILSEIIGGFESHTRN